MKTYLNNILEYINIDSLIYFKINIFLKIILLNRYEQNRELVL